jgi:hypothetical protein
MQIDQNNRLFSVRQILIATILAGPLAGAFMAARNNKDNGKEKASRRVQTIGMAATLLIILISLVLSETILSTEKSMEGSYLLRILGVIFTFLFLHTVVAGLFYLRRTAVSGFQGEGGVSVAFRLVSGWKTLPYLLVGWVVTAYLFSGGPFWFSFNVIYLLPNIYLYNHIKKVFNQPRHRRVFSVFFLLLVVMFPLGESLEHSNYFGLPGILLTIGYYYLPILLYTFLFYLLFDLLRLINGLGHFLPANSIYHINSRRFLLVGFFIASSGIVGTGIYNFNNTQINSYSITVQSEKSNMEELTIAMAADFHFSSRTKKSFVRDFVQKTNSLEPDLVLLAGDLIESMPSGTKKRYIQNQLNKLAATYGVYAIEGNHELYGDNGKLKFFEKTPVQFLRDSVIIIDSAFYLIGRKDRQNSSRKALNQLLSKRNLSLPTILLDHQPYDLDKVAQRDVDIQLSGHTHHGQLFPFNLITKAIYQLSWGYEKIQKTHFFVTCGAQGWGPPVKTGSQSEIMKIHVHFSPKERQ